jgi:hypothetical protein
MMRTGFAGHSCAFETSEQPRTARAKTTRIGSL